jgi:hypothetical protein
VKTTKGKLVGNKCVVHLIENQKLFNRIHSSIVVVAGAECDNDICLIGGWLRSYFMNCVIFSFLCLLSTTLVFL